MSDINQSMEAFDVSIPVAELDRLRAELAASEAAREAAEVKVESLHTFEGVLVLLTAILDQHYPPDFCERYTQDLGPQLITRTRELIERLADPDSELSALRTQLATVTAEHGKARTLAVAQSEAIETLKDQLAARDAELARLRERLTEYAQRELRRVMSDTSEDHWASGWMSGLEYDLWGIVTGDHVGNYGMRDVAPGVIAALRQLSEDAGGWWTYEGFVPMPQWIELYESEAKDDL